MNARPCGGSTFAGASVSDVFGTSASKRAARQGQSVKRRRNKGQERRIQQIGATPSDAIKQKMCCRPAHGRSKSAGERECGDRAPCANAEYASERRERGIVKVRRHADAKNHPDRVIGGWMICMHDEEETECADQRTDRHHDVPAEAIYRAADIGRDQARQPKGRLRIRPSQRRSTSRAPRRSAGQSAPACKKWCPRTKSA